MVPGTIQPIQNKLDEFWREGMIRNKNYEQIVTLGMRGLADTPMSAAAGSQQLEAIVTKQREILKETVNPDITKVPQLWALYKEVQGYYEKGMRVPDDVTLLWSDDNWGDLRRVPTPEERKRSGGDRYLLSLRLCWRATLLQVAQYQLCS